MPSYKKRNAAAKANNQAVTLLGANCFPTFIVFIAFIAPQKGQKGITRFSGMMNQFANQESIGEH